MATVDDVAPLMREAARELAYIGGREDWNPTPQVSAHLRILADAIEKTVLAIDFDPEALNKIGHGVPALRKRITNYRRGIKQLQSSHEIYRRAAETAWAENRELRRERAESRWPTKTAAPTVPETSSDR
jgi:reverse gyrase